MTTLLPGLADPVLESQQVFRAVLDAMAHPGTIVDTGVAPAAPLPLHPATVAVVLTLADYETPLWLDPVANTPDVAAHLRFHCGCPLVEAPNAAAFAVVAAPAAMPPLSAFALGSDQYPDRSTTVIIQVPALTGGRAWTLRGPGIRDVARLAPTGLPADFCDVLSANHALFPCGVDLVFTCGGRLAALPRSTRVEV